MKNKEFTIVHSEWRKEEKEAAVNHFKQHLAWCKSQMKNWNPEGGTKC